MCSFKKANSPCNLQHFLDFIENPFFYGFFSEIAREPASQLDGQPAGRRASWTASQTARRPARQLDSQKDSAGRSGAKYELNRGDKL